MRKRSKGKGRRALNNTVFVHGGGNDFGNIKSCISKFLANRKQVAVLCTSLDPSLLTTIKKTWASLARHGTNIEFIVANNNSISRKRLRVIQNSDGIFINGGDTRKYYKKFLSSSVRSAIEESIENGANIGGSSAGALLLPKKCVIWGSQIQDRGRKISLNSSLANTDYSNANSDIQYGRGLGVTGTLFDVHGTQWGRLPRLIQALKDLKVESGICIDEDTFIVMKEGVCRVYGIGRCYHVKRASGGNYIVRVMKRREALR